MKEELKFSKFDHELIKRTIIYIPGVGNYCKCGCMKLVHQTPGAKRKFYASPACRRRDYERRTPEIVKTSMKATVSLKVYYDEKNKPFRILSLYPIKNHAVKFKITPDMKDIWNQMEVFAKVRLEKKLIIPA